MTKYIPYLTISILISSVLVAFSIFFSTKANAQSICKGLTQSVCQSNNQCSYVAAFVRSDGANVKAFCRAKPGGGAAKQTTAKKTTKKTATNASVPSSTDTSSTSTSKSGSSSDTSIAKKPDTKKKKKAAKKTDTTAKDTTKKETAKKASKTKKLM